MLYIVWRPFSTKTFTNNNYLLYFTVLHGNRVDWRTLHHLALSLPQLEEIHLSNNGIGDPDGSFYHENVRQIFLTCNEITSFDAVHDHLGKLCPRLELLSLGENPLTNIPTSKGGFNQLYSLNLNITKVGFSTLGSTCFAGTL